MRGLTKDSYNAAPKHERFHSINTAQIIEKRALNSMSSLIAANGSTLIGLFKHSSQASACLSVLKTRFSSFLFCLSQTSFCVSNVLGVLSAACAGIISNLMSS